jgi:hypothetical protein
MWLSHWERKRLLSWTGDTGCVSEEDTQGMLLSGKTHRSPACRAREQLKPVHLLGGENSGGEVQTPRDLER